MRLARGMAAAALLALAACERADLTSPHGPAPDPVVLFDGAALVDLDMAGYFQSRVCAVDTQGAIHCRNLPDDGLPSQTFVLARPALSVATEMFSACALDDTGQAWCWGNNWQGNLGDGTTAQRAQPVAMQAPAFTGLDVTASSTCGVTFDGELYCAGSYPRYVADCQGCIVTDSVPARVATAFEVEQVAAGGDFLCAIAAGGTVHCWGQAFQGQLGRRVDATTTDVDLPAAAVAIGASTSHVCAMLSNRENWCWGSGWIGQLGTGRRAEIADPAPVETSVTLDHIALGEAATCALGPEGVPFCWGINDTRIAFTHVAGYPRPTRVDRIPPLIDIATSTPVACGIRHDRVGICWGATEHPVF